MHTIISIFNQLTQSELADCSLFKTIIEHHYEKFKYFYNTIKNIPIDQINKITCTENEVSLHLIVKFNETPESIDYYIDDITESCSKYKSKFKKYFNIDISNTDDTINIYIENHKICREDDLYAD